MAEHEGLAKCRWRCSVASLVPCHLPRSQRLWRCVAMQCWIWETQLAGVQVCKERADSDRSGMVLPQPDRQIEPTDVMNLRASRNKSLPPELTQHNPIPFFPVFPT